MSAAAKWKGLQGNAAFFVTFSLLGLGLALALNIVGLDIGKWLSNLGAIGTWLPVALLCVVGVVAWRKFGSATSFSAASMKPSLNWGTIGVWSTVLYAFSGAESASFMGGEIKNARRTIPRALLVAGVLITAGYMLGTVAILVVLPHGQLNSLEGIMQAISSSAERVGWSGLGPAVALLICISNLGGVGAYLAALSRIPFVAGIDRFLPPAFGRVHPKWGTPYVSLIVQAMCCVLFILLGQFGSTVHGAYQVLVSMTIITNFVPYLFMFAAMIRLQREPVEPGVVRVPGGKPVAIALAAVGIRDHLRGHHRLDDPRPQRAEQAVGGREDSGAQRGAAGRRSVAVFFAEKESSVSIALFQGWFGVGTAGLKAAETSLGAAHFAQKRRELGIPAEGLNFHAPYATCENETEFSHRHGLRLRSTALPARYLIGDEGVEGDSAAPSALFP